MPTWRQEKPKNVKTKPEAKARRFERALCDSSLLFNNLTLKTLQKILT